MNYNELVKSWSEDKKICIDGDIVNVVEVGIFFEDERKISFELSNGEIIYCQEPAEILSSS